MPETEAGAATEDETAGAGEETGSAARGLWEKLGQVEDCQSGWVLVQG